MWPNGKGGVTSSELVCVDWLGFTLAVPITILYNHRLSAPLLSIMQQLWQAELTFIRFFQISKIIILDNQKRICDIWKCIFDIQTTVILISDI